MFVLDLNTFLSLVVCPHYFVPSPSSASTTQHSRCQNTLANIFCWLFLLLHTLHFFPLLCHSHLLTVVTPLPCPSSPAPGAFRRPCVLHSLHTCLFPRLPSDLSDAALSDYYFFFFALLGEHPYLPDLHQLPPCKQSTEGSQLTAAALPPVRTQYLPKHIYWYLCCRFKLLLSYGNNIRSSLLNLVNMSST